jgi:hypothetical protein
MVLLHGSVHGRADVLAEGVVERVVDRVGQGAVARGDVALMAMSSNGPALSWSVVTSVMPGIA